MRPFVPGVGVEPTRHQLARDFKSLVSTNSTTWATLDKKKDLFATSFFWSGKRDSNSRPQPWQGCALPTELLPRLSENISFSELRCKDITFFLYANSFTIFFYKKLKKTVFN